VNAGDALGPLVVESVSAERMKTLAVVLDDPNPIHLVGPRPINQGPANFAWMLDMLGEAVPRARVRDFKVRLLATIEDGCAVCSVWLDVDGGARAVEGTATLILPTD
jgi:3-hydroxybutyryl-CoA dehydratase